MKGVYQVMPHLNGVGATSVAKKWKAKASPTLLSYASVRN
jgi:hypothetical protein